MLSICLHAQLQYAKQYQGTSDNAFVDLALDKNGNIYMTGRFSGTTDFDPHATNTYTLSSSGSAFDIFVTKLDATGNFVWAKGIGGSMTDEAKALAIDTSGNIYLTGHFAGTVDFDPGASTYTLTSGSSLNDMFVLKLNTAGNFVWARQIGNGISSSGVQGWDIAVDLNHKVYTTGNFYQTIDFDPSAIGTVSMTPTPAGSGDIFVSVLDSAGNFVLAKQMGGNDFNTDIGEAVGVDLLGNIYVAGRFYGTADFNPAAATYTLASTGNSDDFVCKLNPLGELIWAKKFGSVSNDFLYSIHLDPLANVYTSGSFVFTADFDPGVGTYTISAGNTNYDGFVSKLDSAGNFKWARSFNGSTGIVETFDVITNMDGNVISTGRFTGTVDMDPGAGTVNLMSSTQKEFISILDSTGQHICAMQIESTGSASGSAVYADTAGYVYTAGSFSGNPDFDPGAGVLTMTCTSTLADGYLKKVSCPTATSVQNQEVEDGSIVIFPNPSNGTFIINTFGKSMNEMQLLDVTGRCLISQNISSELMQFDLADTPNGIYFVKLLSAEGCVVKKITVIK